MTQPPPEPRRRSFPLSQPPTKPSNWWKSVPGQLAIMVMAIGLFVILLGAFGVIGPRA